MEKRWEGKGVAEGPETEKGEPREEMESWSFLRRGVMCCERRGKGKHGYRCEMIYGFGGEQFTWFLLWTFILSNRRKVINWQ
jgi:hypothetical protein